MSGGYSIAGTAAALAAGLLTITSLVAIARAEATKPITHAPWSAVIFERGWPIAATVSVNALIIAATLASILAPATASAVFVAAAVVGFRWYHVMMHRHRAARRS